MTLYVNNVVTSFSVACSMIGHRFVHFDPNENGKSKFEQLLNLLMQLLTYTNGDVGEALDWLNQLERQDQLTNDE